MVRIGSHKFFGRALFAREFALFAGDFFAGFAVEIKSWAENLREDEIP